MYTKIQLRKKGYGDFICISKNDNSGEKVRNCRMFLMDSSSCLSAAMQSRCSSLSRLQDSSLLLATVSYGKMLVVFPKKFRLTGDAAIV